MPERIFVPVGSNSTYAGLLAARAIAGEEVEVVGVRVVPWPVTSASAIRYLANKALRALEVQLGGQQLPRVKLRDVKVTGQYLGPGYGHHTAKADNAIKLILDIEGIQLEPTYSAKTFAAFLDSARQSTSDGPLLFWNTFNSVVPDDLPDHRNLPPEYHRFFTDPGNVID